MNIPAPVVLEHFGTVDKVAEFFDITRQAVYLWGDGPIPRARALELVVRIPEKFGAYAVACEPQREAAA